ncbi:hypothetical protein DL240_06260 [Lujinxingia litoralis]|uniref:Uncharacterized protein n=1 Tax=Lujinxingia litoralis TaxID=2211119 RepID=A0A328C727_9DELT|nr:hypothetical protein [Lujinxingia litoralis]RAL23755.1 hypothetical protein DL240_06260 [Lujinxingia litoralis]
MQGEQSEPQMASLALMIFLIGALTLALWPAAAPASATLRATQNAETAEAAASRNVWADLAHGRR